MPQTFDVVKRLIETGQMPELIRAGIISSTVVEYYNIVQDYNELKRKYRHSTNERIVRMVAEKRKCGVVKVYKARARMR